jgi:hypothetical protein
MGETRRQEGGRRETGDGSLPAPTCKAPMVCVLPLPYERSEKGERKTTTTQQHNNTTVQYESTTKTNKKQCPFLPSPSPALPCPALCTTIPNHLFVHKRSKWPCHHPKRTAPDSSPMCARTHARGGFSTEERSKWAIKLATFPSGGTQARRATPLQRKPGFIFTNPTHPIFFSRRIAPPPQTPHHPFHPVVCVGRINEQKDTVRTETGGGGDRMIVHNIIPIVF